MDLSHLSDEQLEKMANGADQGGDLSHLSDEELEHLASGPSLKDRALNGLAEAGRFVDKYTGGTAARAGIGAAQDVGSLNPLEWAKAGGEAFVKNLGAEPENVPTGKAIVEKAGVPEGIPSTVAGFGMDMVANPVNVLPGVGAAAEALAGPAEKVAAALAPKFASKAGRLAETATGATEREAAKFAPETGRYLLDNKIVRFGSSPGAIAERAQGAMDAAESAKESMLGKDLAQTSVDRNKVYEFIRNKINELKGDDSQLDLVKKLESKSDDIVSTADQFGSEVPLSKSEVIRRGYDKKGKWNSSSDAVENEANKIVANAYREAGENAANLSDPAIGEAFKAAKTTQHRLIPVEAAASRRAGVLNQSPMGGLLDMATATAVPGGAPAKAAAVLGRRVLAPRLASMKAVSLDTLANVISATPEALGKYAGPLSKAAAGGPQSLMMTDKVLQSIDPDYQKMREQLLDPNAADPVEFKISKAAAGRGPGSEK